MKKPIFMRMLLAILFPFRTRRSFLRDYWWHRLFVVIFFIFLGLLPFYLNRTFSEKHFECVVARITYNAQHNIKEEFSNTEIVCSPDHLPILLTNLLVYQFTDSSVGVFYSFLLVSVIIPLGISYILQVFYYKALIYIIFGRKYK